MVCTVKNEEKESERGEDRTAKRRVIGPQHRPRPRRAQLRRLARAASRRPHSSVAPAPSAVRASGLGLGLAFAHVRHRAEVGPALAGPPSVGGRLRPVARLVGLGPARLIPPPKRAPVWRTSSAASAQDASRGRADHSQTLLRRVTIRTASRQSWVPCCLPVGEGRHHARLIRRESRRSRAEALTRTPDPSAIRVIKPSIISPANAPCGRRARGTSRPPPARVAPLTRGCGAELHDTPACAEQSKSANL